MIGKAARVSGVPPLWRETKNYGPIFPWGGFRVEAQSFLDEGGFRVNAQSFLDKGGFRVKAQSFLDQGFRDSP